MAQDWISTACTEPSEEHIAAAEHRQARLTKPAGALGVLETVAIRLAGLQRTERPQAARAAIVLFAGDHGVTAQGVSAYPSAVTVEMLKNFAAGGAAISVLARELGAPLTVVDAGTLAEVPIPGVIVDKPRRGTRDFASEPALTNDEVGFAFEAGRRAVARVTEQGADIVLFGDMGIGNTTSAAAVAAALLGRAPGEMVGAGTGLETEGIQRKADVIARAFKRHGLPRSDASATDVLAAVGGLEIASLAGATIAAAQARIPVLVDGFIVTCAVLAAVRLNSSCWPWLLFSHRSAERGHRIVLDALAADPILNLGMRLGEGSGAAVALAVVRLACSLHNGMATFEEAAVSGPA